MNKIFMRMIALIAVFVCSYAALSLISSVSQLALALDQFSPGVGQPFFIVLCTILSVLFLTPIILFYRLPKPLIPPAQQSGPEYEHYIHLLRSRLIRNKHLIGETLDSEQQIKQAMSKLGVKADELVKQHANSVFVSTALMQNGRLDGLIVLFTQIRMVWLIAHLFYQRPSPRQMLYLYGNVATNVILAQNIQEIEMTELAAPIVISIVPSLNGAIPGMQGISNLILNSLANGSANAFLTLRVGIMARMYCESFTMPVGMLVRTGATRKALEMLGSITKEQGNLVAKGAMDIVGRKFGAMVKGAAAAGDAFVGSAKAAGGAIAGGAVAAGGVITESVAAAGGALNKGAKGVKDGVKNSFKRNKEPAADDGRAN